MEKLKEKLKEILSSDGFDKFKQSQLFVIKTTFFSITALFFIFSIVTIIIGLFSLILMLVGEKIFLFLVLSILFWITLTFVYFYDDHFFDN